MAKEMKITNIETKISGSTYCSNGKLSQQLFGDESGEAFNSFIKSLRYMKFKASKEKDGKKGKYAEKVKAALKITPLRYMGKTLYSKTNAFEVKKKYDALVTGAKTFENIDKD